MARVSDGAVVVVTGGASGLGLGTARALRSRGARIALIDRDADGVHAAAQSLGAETLGIAADICDAAAVTEAIAQIADHFGAIDVVMACAGITGWGPALLIDGTDWERTIETNLLGTWRTVKAALPHLVRSKGYLLIVASGFAASPGPAVSAYAASKAAVESLGRSLRIELAHHGVDVGVAYYSFVATPMVEAIERNPAAMRARAALPAPVRRTYPIDKAAAATANGIEHRAARIIYPGFLRWALLLRGFFGPRSEKPAIKAMPEVERLAADQSRSA